MAIKYQIAMLVPGMAFDGTTLDTKSLGGSETAGLCLARELARLGHNVHLFCNTAKPGECDGVQYHDAAGFDRFAAFIPHDVTIVQRLQVTFRNPMHSKLNILWAHDLAAARESASVNGVMWNVDKVAVLSYYMAEQYKTAFSLPDSALWLTRNGVDTDWVPTCDDTGKPLVRNRKKLMYCARPERGLDVLLRDIMPKLLAADNEIG